MKKKLFTGNDPRDTGSQADTWECRGEIREKDGTPWAVFERDQGNGSGWFTVKVVALVPVPMKANYWAAHNGEKITTTKDSLLMQLHRPTLFRQLKDIL